MELAAGSASLVSSSCFDERHPPSAVVDGSDESFWMTSGMFPQELVLQLAQRSELRRVEVRGVDMASVEVSVCDTSSPLSWEPLCTIKLENTEGTVETESERVDSVRATYIRFRITSGWDDFALMHSVSVKGEPLESEDDL
eukprot:PLAT4764.1.p1 GENE.PLAT4764.1~~PLAT4764.1.p1  ORF type:complete len:141 (+),score=46.60 PLAT4764.1:86-508(+)